MLGGLSFLFPWLLAPLLALPLLWRLLRVTPPRPRVVRFPALFILRDLDVSSRATARTPWWLLLLRCVLIAVFIVALAEPVARRGQEMPGGDLPVLVIVDNGWAAAVNWDKRQLRFKDMLAPLERSKRSIYLLATAPASDREAPVLQGPLTVREALDTLAALAPQPWPSQHDRSADLIAALTPEQKPGLIVFFSDGTSRSALASQQMLVAAQAMAADITVVDDDRANQPFVLRAVDGAPGGLSFEIEALKPSAQATEMTLLATDENGALIDETRVTIAAGEKTGRIEWSIDEGLREKISRIAVRAPAMAAGVYLTDAQWRQRPVGIIAESGQKDNASFLNEVYYLRRALESDATLHIDQLDALLQRQRAAIVWPDSVALTTAERIRLRQWVEEGGFLIRFAGPNLAANPQDDLVPVTLRQGQRAMAGAMTWEKPVKLAAIAESSPFYGLDVPADVTVTRQVLASPDPETFSHSWLQLTDGTPLITGAVVGKGQLALVHTSAGPDWSNFCYSGLYVETLRRMTALARGVKGQPGALTLVPVQLMDGYGTLQPPDSASIAGPMTVGGAYIPSPLTPPGLYGDGGQWRAYTLGQGVSGLYPLPSLPQGINRTGYSLEGEVSYKAALLRLAVLLLAADFLATLSLRGLIRWPLLGLLHLRRAVPALLALSLLLATQVAQAQDSEDGAPSAAMTVSSVYLAYVETGDVTVDQLSQHGLEALARAVTARTSIRIRGVVAVDPEIDPLSAYPFLYWPMTSAQRPLSLSAAQKVQGYLAHGGLIVFDTRDLQFGDMKGQTVGVQRLRDLTQSLQLPALAPVEKGHILRKSFYLLESFPGLYAGGQVWVEKEPNPNYDAVTSVIIGGNDWAAAWSDDPAERSRLPVQPGGERQREIALRFGINIVMVALTGNYKSDQVHVPFILQRMEQ